MCVRGGSRPSERTRRTFLLLAVVLLALAFWASATPTHGSLGTTAGGPSSVAAPASLTRAPVSRPHATPASPTSGFPVSLAVSPNPATLPVAIVATATPHDVNCSSGFNFVFNWGDGSKNTTVTNGTDRHYYNSTVSTLASVTITVTVLDCMLPPAIGTGYSQPFFYPPVGAVLSTNVTSTSQVSRNASSLDVAFTVTGTGGAASGALYPYYSNWSFGDGTRLTMVGVPSSLSLTETHTFVRPSGLSGPAIFSVWVTLTDHLNGNNTTRFLVQLNGTAVAPTHPSSAFPTTYLYAAVAGAVVVVAVVLVVLLRRRGSSSSKPEASSRSTRKKGDRKASSEEEEAGRPSPAAAAGADGSEAEMGEPAIGGPGSSSTSKSKRGSSLREGTPSRTVAEVGAASSRTSGGAARSEGPVPCVICGTPLPSADAPCPKCTPSMVPIVPMEAPVAEPESAFGPSGPPLPGLGSTAITPPPLQVGPETAHPAPSEPAEAAPAPAPAAPAPAPVAPVSYVPTAPTPEMEPMPVAKRSEGPEPGVDLTPVTPLPQRAALPTVPSPSPAPSTGTASSVSASAAAPSSATGLSATSAPGSPAFLFPVSTKSLFEKLVQEAPSTPTEGPTTPPTSPALSASSSSTPGPSAPPEEHPAAPLSCLVCGGTLQEGFCPSCKMQWRE